MVRLIERHLDPELLCQRGDPVIDIVESERAVYVRLAPAEKVQVGPVNDQDFHVSPAQNKKLPKAVSESTAQKRKIYVLRTL
jgi:hypothetical protein